MIYIAPKSQKRIRAQVSLLGKKVSRMDHQSKVCVLMLDEKSLKSTLPYDTDTSKDVVGHDDFCHLGAGTLVCNNARVYGKRCVCVCVCVKWKQPIGYFLTNNATCAEKLVSLVTTAVEKLSVVGVDVRVTVCDQGTTNQQMLKQCGVSVEKLFAELQGKQIIFMYDPSSIRAH